MNRAVSVALLAACATACSERPTAPVQESLGAGRTASANVAINQSANPLDVAVIGDTPCGTAAIALFPTMVQAINRDAKVREVVHVGDFKSGSELCTDARFQIASDRHGSSASRS